MSKRPFSLFAAVAALPLLTQTAGAQNDANDLPWATEQVVVIDGDVSEWPEDSYIAVTEHHVAIRFRLRGVVTPTRAPMPIQVHADIDGYAPTGEAIYGMGADVRIVLSDPNRTERGPRITVIGLDENEPPKPIEPSDIGLIFAPTHAGDWIEMRFDRLSKHRPAAPARMDGRPVIPVMQFRAYAGGQRAIAPEGGSFRAKLRPDSGRAGFADETVPDAAPGSVRVMSWNVLWGGPTENPAPFARVIEAIKPDVILFQEWQRDDIAGETIAAWLNEHATWAGTDWEAQAPDAWGPGLAARHRMTHKGPRDIKAGGTRWNFPIRLAAASIDVPGYGPVVFGSIHFKAGGYLGSEEDHRRITEAAAVNDVLRDLRDDSGARAVVFGGDLNMNGTTAIIPTATDGLDSDGSVLDVVPVGVLGDPGATYTFGRPGQHSTFPRLDYITIPDAGADVTAAFVFDPTRLTNEALSRMGVQREDVMASDHLPVVVDIKFND